MSSPLRQLLDTNLADNLCGVERTTSKPFGNGGTRCEFASALLEIMIIIKFRRNSSRRLYTCTHRFKHALLRLHVSQRERNEGRETWYQPSDVGAGVADLCVVVITNSRCLTHASDLNGSRQHCRLPPLR